MNVRGKRRDSGRAPRRSTFRRRPSLRYSAPMARSKAGAGATLSFERPIAELEEEIRELKKAQEAGTTDVSKELRAVEERTAALMREIFSQLTPWQRVQLARH